jgi:hypothetical protein
MSMKTFALAGLVIVSAALVAAPAQAARTEHHTGLDMPGLHESNSPSPRAGRAERAERVDRTEGRRRAVRAAARSNDDGDSRPQRRRSARNWDNDSSGVGSRPGAWCGWWMRTQRGGGPEYNLAANWRNYGSPTHAQVGAVVVWNHHVGQITGRASNGQWIVQSGNDGGRVRERARSVDGASFRI